MTIGLMPPVRTAGAWPNAAGAAAGPPVGAMGDRSLAAVDRVAGELRAARRVTVLTGAGVSAASGVPTFRGADGLWKEYRATDLATPGAFARDPALVWEWYGWRR